MTRVDFYVLEDGAQGNRYALACRIAEKAWKQGHKVLIHAASENDARHIDRLLWTYRELSFVPHAIGNGDNDDVNPVLISPGLTASPLHDVLINLDVNTPAYFSQFERVAELIDHDPAYRASGRDRYRFYRERGYPLYKHDIK
jgi:DNA polymerase-3 subunit chi